MLKHYATLAWRTLVAQKVLSIVNVLSLSVGLACFSLFLLYAVHEFSFDRFHARADRLYQVYRNSQAMAGREASMDAHMPMPLGPAMEADLADVEAAVRLRVPWGEGFVRVGSEVLRRGVAYADPAFFEVFTFPLRYGDPATALADPRGIVLTVPTALDLFGTDAAVGRPLEIRQGDAYETFTVTAVAEAPPPNSSIRFEMLGSYAYYAATPEGERYRDNWNRSAFQTFVLLRPGSGLADDAERLLAFRRTYYPDEEAELRESGRWSGPDAPVTFGLQPLRTLHTDTRVSSAADPVPPGRVWMLLAVAGGVLLIGCINFTTLSIGRAAGRAREIGVRKAVGSGRGQLAAQFLVEALLLSGAAALLGLAIAQFALPFFNALADRQLAFSLTRYPEIAGLLVAAVAGAGLVAGSYPAVVLSGFRPIEVLRRRARVGGSNLFTRSLLTAQFVLSIGLIAVTLVVARQLDFMQTKHPGFDKENVVVVDAEGLDTETLYPRFRTALEARPEVAGVAAAELGLGAEAGWSLTGWDYHGELKEAYEYFVDGDYLDVMGLELAAGRAFDAARSADTTEAVIVNEAFARDFGWTPEEAVGQPLTGYSTGFTPVVVGVVRDFHYRSFHEEVAPQLFHQHADYRPFKFLVRIRPGDPAPALAAIRTAWAGVAPEVPLIYSFLDDDLDRFYRTEARFARIMGWAGGLSIFLAGLGLFGLATLAAVNRTKEIGIRKVFGAELHHLIGLMTSGFLWLVALAAAIALPAAWLLMRHWLDSFAYRIDMPWTSFALAAGIALVVAFLTVTVQTLRVALADPVRSLRYE